MTILEQQGAAALTAARVLSTAGTERKNAALNAIADKLEAKAADWLAANAEDVAAARSGGMTESLLDRLTLTEAVCGDLEKHAYSVNDHVADAALRNRHILAAV